MLFFAFLAGLAGSIGWLLFWLILGFFFSERSFIWFVLPLCAAMSDNVGMAVLSIVGAWFALVTMYAIKADARLQALEHVEAVLRARGIDTFFLVS